MLVIYTRLRLQGAFHGTESRVVELPDLDEHQEPTPIPDGARLAPQGATPHDWEIDSIPRDVTVSA